MNDIICWWSGGVTSAVACKMTIDLYGKDRCRVIFIDTFNEDEDTYRFKKDCEAWYGIEIETITAIGSRFDSIEDVWFTYLSLNVATGAICSAELKRRTRQIWERSNKFNHQVFGFDIDEPKRAKGLKQHYPYTNPLFPLLYEAVSKKQCIKTIEEAGIRIPRMYELGFTNNNCFNTGCVQGGIGYWKKMQSEYPDKFEYMASIEHRLTDERGEPVTILKDQSKDAKKSGKTLVFLKPHPNYPEYKDITMMKGRDVEPLVECNGFCGPKHK